MNNMYEWSPLLEGKYRAQAESALDEIARHIYKRSAVDDGFGLISGLPGQLLFLAVCRGEAFIEDPVFDDLTENFAVDLDIGGSLYRGLAGIGSVLKLIDDRHGIFEQNIFSELYGTVRKFMRKDMLEGNFDFMHGFLGECFFLMEQGRNEETLAAFKEAIYVLEQLSRQQERGIGWVAFHELRLQYPQTDLASVQWDCNLGMSHGSPGILLVLYRMAELYEELDLKPLIEDCLECMLWEFSEQNRAEHGYYYSSYAGTLGKRYRGQLSWCYSDLSISLMYLSLWQRRGDKTLFEMGIRLADNCAAKRLEDTSSMGSGLCHGAAGVGHMFHKLYRITGKETYKEAAFYWYGILLEKFLVREEGQICAYNFSKKNGVFEKADDNGFLYGLSGIGLSLYSAISNDAPVWDRLLLL